MSPTVWRTFGCDVDDIERDEDIGSLKRSNYKTSCGLCELLGNVTMDDDFSVDAGRVLMRDQRNTELYKPLAEACKHGVTCESSYSL